MTRKNRLPDEILENIRQFAGNFRLYKGELIQTIDKKSVDFRTLEKKIKERQELTYFMIFGNGWSNVITGSNCILPTGYYKNYFQNGENMINWKVTVTWLDKISDYISEQHTDVVGQLICDENNFPPRRVFSWEYNGKTDVLTFKYIRKSFLPGVMDGWEAFEKPITHSETIEYTIK